MTAPIALFVYNRPEHTKMTVEALQKNILAKESDLFIFSDGYKDQNSADKVNEVRCYLKTISGFKSVTVIEREKNFGLATSIIFGVTEIVNRFGTIIVLEDDLVTSPFFLSYMNDGLKIYKNDEKVASVHGYVYPIKEKLPETFFIRGADCWGWSTWNRAWKHFEINGQKLYDELVKRELEKEFDFGNTFGYMKMLRGQIAGRNNSWAIRWYASTFLDEMLTLYPGRSLVKNIGFDGSGVHSGSGTDKFFGVTMSDGPVQVIHLPVEEFNSNRKIFEKYFRSIGPGLFSRLKNKIRLEVGKIVKSHFK